MFRPNPHRLWRLRCWLLLAALWLGPAEPRAADRPPNIVFILADDLGYGELGSYGQKKIRTPHLDALAREGTRFTRHYAGNPVCAPSRCVLMTGRHPGHAVVRDNREVQPEGQHPLPAGIPTVAGLLKAAGYRTGAFGKWGLGPPGSSGDPLQQGFDRFYGYNCQRVAHNHHPPHLWSDTTKVALNNPRFSAHQRLPAGADPNDPASYRGFTGADYAPDLIGEEAVKFIDANHKEPFFLYFPSTIPHLAIQVPEDSLAEYRGLFPETPYVGDKAYLPHPTPRAAYAAMITRMDRDVGRIVARVRELGLEEETIFIFTSDNGPTYNGLGGSDSDFFESAPGLRGLKGSMHDGGIRVPLIVSWKGRIEAGRVSHHLCGFEDWLPTLLELAGAGDRIPADTDGTSFAPELLGKPQTPKPFVYREFPSYSGQQAVWMGKWKAIRRNLLAKTNPNTTLKTELHDLEADPGETRDLAAEQPGQLARMIQVMRENHTPSAVFPFAPLDTPGAESDRRGR